MQSIKTLLVGLDLMHVAELV